MKYTFNQTIHPDGDIEQTVESDFNGRVEMVGRWIAKTREENLIKALIELGWTPPQGVR